jgi:hypothetical protein
MAMVILTVHDHLQATVIAMTNGSAMPCASASKSNVNNEEGRHHLLSVLVRSSAVLAARISRPGTQSVILIGSNELESDVSHIWPRFIFHL